MNHTIEAQVLGRPKQNLKPKGRKGFGITRPSRSSILACCLPILDSECPCLLSGKFIFSIDCFWSFDATRALVLYVRYCSFLHLRRAKPSWPVPVSVGGGPRDEMCLRCKGGLGPLI